MPPLKGRAPCDSVARTESFNPCTPGIVVEERTWARGRLRSGSGSGARSRQCRPCVRSDPELGERSAERSASAHAARGMRTNRSSALRPFGI
eukprot:4676955-Pleurochrysis_carterae.AAC.1